MSPPISTQTILIEPNLTLDTVFSLNLNVYVGTTVITRKNHEEVFELLKTHDHINLIICRAQVNNQRSALEIYKFLQAQDRNIPIIVLGDEPLLMAKAHMLPDKAGEIDIQNLLKVAASILGVTPKDMFVKQVPDYFPIPIEFFISINSLICPVFERSKAVSHEDIIYEQCFDEGTSVSMADIEERIKRGTTKLYIPKEMRLKFTNAFTNYLVEKLNSPIMTDEVRAILSSNSIEVIREQLLTAGLSSDTLILAKASINSILTMVEKTPKMMDLLNKIIVDKTSYRYRVAQLTTYIAFHALSNLEWGTPEQQYKLAFVALFHDITLDTDRLALVRDERQLHSAALQEVERFQVQTHCVEAAKIILNYPHAPLGAEDIIRQHHGALTGMGFPKNYSKNITPLAIVFLICEDYAHALLTTPREKFKHIKMIEVLKGRYYKVMYRKVIRALENMV